MVTFNPNNANINARTLGVGNSPQVRRFNGPSANRLGGASVAGSMRRSIFDANAMRGANIPSRVSYANPSGVGSTSSTNLAEIIGLVSAGLSMVGAGLGVAGQIREARNNSAPPNPGNDVLPKTIQDANASISGMKGATTSTELNAAISEANEQLVTLNEQKEELDTYLEDSEQKYETAKKTVTDYADEMRGLEKEIDAQEDNVSNAKTIRDDASNTLKQCGQAVSEATTRYEGACAKVTEAQATLDRTPKEITTINADGTITKEPNPARAKAEQALEAAQEAKEQAKTKLDEAVRARDDADGKLKEAEQKFLEAQRVLDEEQGKLDKLNQEKENAEREYETAKDNMQTYQNKKNELQQINQKIQTLESEIPKQESRLLRLNERDGKRKSKLDGKIDDETTKMKKINEKYDGASEAKQVRLDRRFNEHMAKGKALMDEQDRYQGAIKSNADAVKDIKNNKSSVLTGLKNASEGTEKKFYGRTWVKSSEDIWYVKGNRQHYVSSKELYEELRSHL